MGTTVQEALDLRKQRQTDSVSNALAQRKRYMQYNAPKKVSEISNRLQALMGQYNKKVSSYGGGTPTVFGGAAQNDVAEMQNITVELGKLKHEFDQYRSYLDKDTSEAMSESFVGLSDALNGMRAVASSGTQFESADQYKAAQEQAAYRQRVDAMSSSELMQHSKDVVQSKKDKASRYEYAAYYVDMLEEGKEQDWILENFPEYKSAYDEFVSTNKIDISVHTPAAVRQMIYEEYMKDPEPTWGKDPVLYYDDDGLAMTANTLITIKKMDETLAAIEADPAASGYYADYQLYRVEHDKLGQARSYAANAFNSGAVPYEATAEDKANWKYIVDKYGKQYGFTEEDINKPWLDGVLSNIIQVEGGKLYDAEKSASEKLKNLGYSTDEIDAYQRWLQQRERYAQQQKKNAEFARKYPVLSTVGAIVSAPFQIIEYADDLVQGMVAGTKGEYSAHKLNNTLDNAVGNFSDTATSMVASEIESAVLNAGGAEWVAKLASTAYSGITSAAESAAIALVSGGLFGPAAGAKIAAGVMGSQAAASQYRTAIRNGASNGQAALSSIAAGVAECFFEKYSIEGILDLKAARLDTSSLRSFFKSALQRSGNVAWQGVTEASEELATELANRMADDLINTDHSNYYVAVDRYVRQGMTPEQAHHQASVDWGAQLVESALGGLIGGVASGGLVSGVSGAGQLIDQRRSDKEFASLAGADDRALSDVMSLAQEVMDQADGKTKTKIQQLMKNVQDDKSQANIQALVRAVNTIRKAQIVTENKSTLREARKSGDRQAVADAKTALASARDDAGQYAQERVISGVVDRAMSKAMVKNSYAVGTGTTNKHTGEDIKITGIYRTRERGEPTLIFKLDDGSTIRSEDVSYSNNNLAMMAEALAETGIRADYAMSLLESVSEEMGADAMVEVVLGMQAAIDAGRVGESTGTARRVRFVDALTDEQFQTAYAAGRSLANDHFNKQKGRASQKTAADVKLAQEDGKFVGSFYDGTRAAVLGSGETQDDRTLTNTSGDGTVSSDDVKNMARNRKYMEYFPTSHKNGDTHFWCTMWAKSNMVQSGDYGVVEFAGRYYEIQKHDDADFGYRIISQLTKDQYKRRKDKGVYEYELSAQIDDGRNLPDSSSVFDQKHEAFQERSTDDQPSVRHGSADEGVHELGDSPHSGNRKNSLRRDRSDVRGQRRAQGSADPAAVGGQTVSVSNIGMSGDGTVSSDDVKNMARNKGYAKPAFRPQYKTLRGVDARAHYDARQWADAHQNHDRGIIEADGYWYVIEQFVDMDCNYQVVTRLTEKQYKKVKGDIEDVREYLRENDGSRTVHRCIGGVIQRFGYEGSGAYDDSLSARHSGEGDRVHEMDSNPYHPRWTDPLYGARVGDDSQRYSSRQTASGYGKGSGGNKNSYRNAQETVKTTESKKTDGEPNGRLSVFIRDGGILRATTQAQINVMDELAKLTNTNIEVYASSVVNGVRQFVDRRGGVHTGNAAYTRVGNTIMVDINAGDYLNGLMLNAVSHELVHFIAEMSPEKFRKLADFVVGKFGEKGRSVTELIHAKQEKYGLQGQKLSFMDAFEEVVADSVESMLAQKADKIVSDIAEMRRVDTDLAKTFVDKLKDLVGKMVNVFRKNNFPSDPETKEGRFFAKWTEVQDELAGIFAEAAADAADQAALAARRTDTVSENKKTADNVTGEESVKYSKRYLAAKVNGNILSLVREVEGNTYKAKDKVGLGVVSDRVAQEIHKITGINVHGFRVVLEARQIDHIIKRHGKHGKADSSMADSKDIARMEFTLNAPDDIRRSGKTTAYVQLVNGRNKSVDTVLYEKNIGDKSYYVVQAVPDTKSRTLFIVSAFIGKSGYKKIDALQFTDAESPSATSEIAAVSTSNNIVAESMQNSNPSDEKSSRRTLTKENTPDDAGVKNMARKANFSSAIDSWDGKTIGFSFVVGKTSKALLDANIPNKQIRWDASKIKNLLGKHNGMSVTVIKEIPELLENPIIVIDSKTDVDSKIIMGDLRDENKKTVTVVFKLTPSSKKGNVLDLIKISSAEGRSHINSLFYYEDGTPIAVRYFDKKRIQDWLYVNRVQFPLRNLGPDSIDSISNPAEKINPSEEKSSRRTLTKENTPDDTGVVRYSFRNSANGTAHDILMPYNQELRSYIEVRGDVIVDTYDQLVDVVNKAFDNPNDKFTAYLGVLPYSTLRSIEKSVPNIPRDLNGHLFKVGRNYSIAIESDNIIHLTDDKKTMTRKDVVDFLDRIADVIVEFDSVNFDYYVDGYGQRTKGILFKRSFSDGVMESFDLVSGKKNSLKIQTVYLDSASYQKRKSAKTLPVQNTASAHTSKTGAGQTSTAIISNSDQESQEKAEKSSLRTLTKENTPDDTGVKNSIRNTRTIPYGEQIRKIEKGQMKRSDSLYVGAPSARLQHVGFSANPFAMNQADYRKSRRKAGNNKHYSSHAVPVSFFVSLPDRLATAPLLVDNGDRITIITDYQMDDTKGNPSLVVVGVLQNSPMEGEYVNLIKSIYPYDDIVNRLTDASAQGRLVVLDKKKAKQMLATVGVQPSKVSNLLDLSRGTLSQLDGDVKSKTVENSPSASKSSRRTLTKENTPDDTGVKNSIRNIVGESGTEYGLGVYLDSSFLSNITDANEREALLNLWIKEMSGVRLPVFTSSGERIAITFAYNDRKYKTENGKKKPVNYHLSGYLRNPIKRLSVVQVDEVVYVSQYDAEEPAKHRHGWLDDDGKNNWEKRVVYLQEKNNAVWRATLQIATTNTGEKVLYEIYPIEMVEGPGTSGASTTTDSVQQDNAKSQGDSKKSSLRNINERQIIVDMLKSLPYEVQHNQYFQEYLQKVSVLDRKQTQLDDLNAEWKDLMFRPGKRSEETKARLAEIRTQADALNRAIMKMDRRLLDLAEFRPFRNLVRNAAKKQKAADAQRMADYRQEVKTRAERDKVIRVMKTINQYIRHNSKEKHVPIGLLKPVAEAMNAINLDWSAGENAKVKHYLNEIKVQYDKILNDPDPMVANVHDEEIAALMEDAIDLVGDVSIHDMSQEQLDAVYQLFKSLHKRIVGANRTRTEGRQEDIREMEKQITGEIHSVAKSREGGTDTGEALRKFVWDELKPIYAFRRIGSKTLQELFQRILDGQYVCARDIDEANQFKIGLDRKYRASTWKMDEVFSFRDRNNQVFELTRAQVFCVYATSRREQGVNHLFGYGLVSARTVKFEKKKNALIKIKKHINKQTAHPLNETTLAEIIETLDDNQKSYIEEMQEYLSDVMGAKGNEISLMLYEMKMFGEKHYWPLHTVAWWNAFDPEAGVDPKIKSPAWSKKINKYAKSPIVVDDFSNVWSQHVEEMSMYHGLALPVDDFTRIMNCRNVIEGGQVGGVRQALEDVFGPAPGQYVANLLRDLNGGIRMNPGSGVVDKGLTLAKKAAVLLSPAVAIQQGSSIVRAMAYVSPKYFGKSFLEGLKLHEHNQQWEEMKQFAEVAIIKEMGGFDAGLGQTAREWLKKKEYEGFKDNVKALFLDKAHREDAMSYLPNIVDELAWVQIWNACKAEIANTTNLKGEALLRAAGKRCNEVIELTQVYDSTLSRSGLMRAQDTGAKMVTAFMAEPAVVINMFYDAALGLARHREGAGKHFLRVGSVLIGSMILNDLLRSIVHAIWDEDEDKTYLEKYVKAFVGNLISDINPFNSIPFARDIVSISQGYNVDRMDMVPISDLYKAIERAGSDGCTVEEVFDIVLAVGALLGYPLGKLKKFIKGVVNSVKVAGSGRKETWTGLMNAALEGRTGKDTTKANLLYMAYLRGDSVAIRQARSAYKTQSSADSGIKDALRENEPDVHEAAVLRYEGNVERSAALVKKIADITNVPLSLVQDAVMLEMEAYRKEQLQDDEEIYDGSTEEKTVDPNAYTYTDLKLALEQGREAETIVEAIIADKKASGFTAKQAKAQVRSSVWNTYRSSYYEAYKSNDKAGMERIRTLLMSTGLWTSTELKNTMKNYIKNQEEKE